MEVAFDSKEELYFSWYLEELMEAGYLKSWEYQPASFILSNKVTVKKIKIGKKNNTIVEKTILQPHEYTADFKLYWDNKAKNLFFIDIFEESENKKIPFLAQKAENGEYFSIVDVKSNFNMQNMNRLFSVNQKWMWDKYNIYIQKIIPIGKKCLFSETFTPKRFLKTDKTEKDRKINYNVILLLDYINKQL